MIGIGAGDPDYVTAQAVAALNDTQVFFAMDKAPNKGAVKDDLVALRRQICERFIREPGYRFVELPDPERARAAPDSAAYRQAVADWHAARAQVWAEAIESELAPGGVGAFLAWGDPSLYDSTLRILDAVAARVDIDYDVIPGITAIQALTARHRIPLNDVGEPVLVTTGRQLRDNGLSGSAVVMLDGDCSFLELPAADPNLVGRLSGHAGRAVGVRHRRRSGRPRSPSCAPRRATGMAGSWTPTCCDPPTDRRAMARSTAWGASSCAQR